MRARGILDATCPTRNPNLLDCSHQRVYRNAIPNISRDTVRASIMSARDRDLAVDERHRLHFDTVLEDMGELFEGDRKLDSPGARSMRGCAGVRRAARVSARAGPPGDAAAAAVAALSLLCVSGGVPGSDDAIRRALWDRLRKRDEPFAPQRRGSARGCRAAVVPGRRARGIVHAASGECGGLAR